MRLISQDGAIDVPYDYFSLSITTGKYEDVEVACIYCHNLSSPKGTKLAEYSSKEKAEKSMEMLREQYAHMKRVECMSASLASCEVSTLSNKDAKLLGDEVQKLMCFQFPQDEDVEV